MAHAIVVGAGPAGASLAFLLADRGIEVTLLERQRDFAREFRGEVLLPGGIDALAQMGFAGSLAQVPQMRPDSVVLFFNRKRIFELALEPALLSGPLPLAVSQSGLL